MRSTTGSALLLVAVFAFAGLADEKALKGDAIATVSVPGMT